MDAQSAGETRPDSETLPKINRIPPQAEAEAATSSVTGSPAFRPRIRREEWDVKFAFGLIILVVLVNVSLTFLLGSHQPPEKLGELAPSADMPPEHVPEIITGNDAMPPQPQDREIIVPVTTQEKKGETQTYISVERKQLLLRRLSAVPERENAVEQDIKNVRKQKTSSVLRENEKEQPTQGEYQP